MLYGNANKICCYCYVYPTEMTQTLWAKGDHLCVWKVSHKCELDNIRET